MLEIFHEHEHTLSGYRKTAINNVIGFVNVKKILIDYGRPSYYLKDYMQSLPVMPEHSAIQDVLVHMKKERVHMALLLDEYGGSAGLVTMEDILEEIVGEIRDEFDTEEVSDIQKVEEGLYHINGRTLLDDIEKQLGITFSNEEDIDTIGGCFK